VVESAAGQISQDTTGNAATVTNGITTASSVESLSDVTDAGSGIIITAAERTKLSGVATSATANSTDATLLARANHTGTQTASTISDFDTEVEGNSVVTANAAKVSASGSVTSHNDVSAAGSGSIITNTERSNLSTLYTNLKSGTSTTINDGANTNSALELAATTAKLKTGVTEIKLEETSPGEIDFIVAAGASGSEAAYTAATLSGTTTANEAELLFGATTKVYFEGASNAKAQVRFTGSGNAALTLPTSTGTLALTSDVFDGAYGSLSGTPTIPTNNNQLSNGAGYTTLALGTSSTTALAGNTALLALGTSSTTALAGDTALLALGTSSTTALAGNTAVDDVSVANLKTALGSNLGSTTIGDSNDTITVGNDLIVTGDLTVNGDTTTVNTTNLLVDDTFISLNSGGASNVDAGIVFEGADNKVFGWDNSQESGRFGVDYAGGDASATGGGFAPDAWLSTVHTASGASGQTSALAQIGNMYVNSDNQDIYIYS